MKKSVKIMGALALFCTLIIGQIAQAKPAADIRILVMGQDSDPRTMKRSSQAFKAVLTALKSSMNDHGYRMVDEEAVAADLGWQIATRRSKLELLDTIKLMNKSDTASHHSRLLAVFSLHSQFHDKRTRNEISVRVSGELYDVQSNEFLTGFELPEQTFPAPSRCSNLCAADLVRDHASDIASRVGHGLAEQLAHRHKSNAISEPRAPYSAGLETPYTLVLDRIEDRDMAAIIEIATSEFPGFVRYELLDRKPDTRRYSYISKASKLKLEEWFALLLTDMELEPDKDIQILMQGSEISIVGLNGLEIEKPKTSVRFQ